MSTFQLHAQVWVRYEDIWYEGRIHALKKKCAKVWFPDEGALSNWISVDHEDLTAACPTGTSESVRSLSGMSEKDILHSEPVPDPDDEPSDSQVLLTFCACVTL